MGGPGSKERDGSSWYPSGCIQQQVTEKSSKQCRNHKEVTAPLAKNLRQANPGLLWCLSDTVREIGLLFLLCHPGGTVFSCSITRWLPKLPILTGLLPSRKNFFFLYVSLFLQGVAFSNPLTTSPYIFLFIFYLKYSWHKMLLVSPFILHDWLVQVGMVLFLFVPKFTDPGNSLGSLADLASWFPLHPIGQNQSHVHPPTNP